MLHGLTKAEARIAGLMTSLKTLPEGEPVYREGEAGSATAN